MFALYLLGGGLADSALSKMRVPMIGPTARATYNQVKGGWMSVSEARWEQLRKGCSCGSSKTRVQVSGASLGYTPARCT